MTIQTNDINLNRYELWMRFLGTYGLFTFFAILEK